MLCWQSNAYVVHERDNSRSSAAFALLGDDDDGTVVLRMAPGIHLRGSVLNVIVYCGSGI